jgi:hypothetical protein
VTDSKNWRECPRCGMERRATYPRGIVCGHRRYDPARREMVPCEGSGKIGVRLSEGQAVRRGAGRHCPQCGQEVPAA